MTEYEPPPLLLPEICATFGRVITRNPDYWVRLAPDRFSEELLHQLPPSATRSGSVPGEMWRRLALPFHPTWNGGHSPDNPAKYKATEQFLEACLVKLKRQFYGDDDARLPFDPRIEGLHREEFGLSARYLHSVLLRFEDHITAPFFCRECGVFGDASM